MCTVAAKLSNHTSSWPLEPYTQMMGFSVIVFTVLEVCWSFFCYEAAALLPHGSGFGVQGLVWNFADTKQGKGSWMLASVCALRLPSVAVQIFQT